MYINNDFKLRGVTVANESNNILIVSASYGGGHNQVARALTQAIQLQDPNLNVITVDYCDLLLPILSRISQFSYYQSMRHFPVGVGYGLYYQATGKISSESFWQRRMNKLGYAELITLIERLNPRIVIATFPIPAGVLSEMKEAGILKVPAVTVITDICVHNQWIHPYTDLYIVADHEVADGLVERGISRKRIAVTGIPIFSNFNDDFDIDQLRQEFEVEPGEKLVLFMGGSQGLFLTTRFSQILHNIGNNTKAIVITGSNSELYEKLQSSLGNLNTNIRVMKYVENMAGLMELANVLVTKCGGITVSEALAKGLPMIIYKPMPGQEGENANYLWRHRAAIIAKSEHRLRNAITRMVNDEEFCERFRQNCLKLGCPDSAKVSAALILNQMASLVESRTNFMPNVKQVSEYLG